MLTTEIGEKTYATVVKVIKTPNHKGDEPLLEVREMEKVKKQVQTQRVRKN
ncbi:hypothetical protein ACJMK2_004484, partial [Sinanodonta woodiana]